MLSSPQQRTKSISAMSDSKDRDGRDSQNSNSGPNTPMGSTVPFSRSSSLTLGSPSSSSSSSNSNSGGSWADKVRSSSGSCDLLRALFQILISRAISLAPTGIVYDARCLLHKGGREAWEAPERVEQLYERLLNSGVNPKFRGPAGKMQSKILIQI